MKGQGILGRTIADTPIAVIDLETTGLVPGADRVIEVSVVRVEPSKPPAVMLDTLVNPRRPVSATEIHGITDSHVANAPTFDEIAGNLVDALSGAVAASYNANFDFKFLDCELRQVGVTATIPHLCLMYMRPMLGLGKRCRLGQACAEHGIHYASSHVAVGDARAAAALWPVYLQELGNRGFQSFSDLSKLKKYKFMDSFASPTLESNVTKHLRRNAIAKARSKPAESIAPIAPAVGRPAEYPPPVTTTDEGVKVYWDVLKIMLSDLNVSDEEMQQLAVLQKSLGLQKEHIWALHARAFSGVLSQFALDRKIENHEQETIRRVFQCLKRLGWAPGE